MDKETEKPPVSLLSSHVSFHGKQILISDYILGTASLALMSDNLQGTERETLEADVKRFPSLWEEFDKIISSLSEDVCLPLSAVAVLLIRSVHEMGALSHASMAAGRAWAPQIISETAPQIVAKTKSEIGRNAGKRGGENRRKNRPWIEKAAILAAASLSRRPSLSREKVAKEIEDKWPSITSGWKGDYPSRKTLLGYIIELEDKGVLPSRPRRRKK